LHIPPDHAAEPGKINAVLAYAEPIDDVRATRRVVGVGRTGCMRARGAARPNEPCSTSWSQRLLCFSSRFTGGLRFSTTAHEPEHECAERKPERPRQSGLIHDYPLQFVDPQLMLLPSESLVEEVAAIAQPVKMLGTQRAMPRRRACDKIENELHAHVPDCASSIGEQRKVSSRVRDPTVDRGVRSIAQHARTARFARDSSEHFDVVPQRHSATAQTAHDSAKRRTTTRPRW